VPLDLQGQEIWPLFLNQEPPNDWICKEDCGGISEKVSKCSFFQSISGKVSKCSFFQSRRSLNILKYSVNDVSLPQQQKNGFGLVNPLELDALGQVFPPCFFVALFLFKF